ncbi:Velvet factor [Penicillium angulare]|uniref:Velvet factor n=1 Tax=Penicillium angulare TaxID=116970 RepID=UPI00253F7973|nr:Velvet factor [Penicillium angulare]KAJ5291310.1 Velvet factor [Penicillium angulare]
MASRPPMMAPHNETDSMTSRITREGKQITYRLTVMQQPERARACGAGAKSSADRRPVDPPPVVELRIFESEPGPDQPQTDITFAYNANFFLYATLDTARPVAHGRMAGPPSCPVLTGVPVAGVAYLDRPSQAGYFIFPDLSVRHEGRYRLNFHLYEEIKEAKDADKDSSDPLPNQIRNNLGKPGPPQASLSFRLEVKSVPFTVYSAKKFPGLATSTSLSRVIAEQGCRVRIRRDVRMRRRGDKRDEEFDYDEERNGAVYARSSDRYSTPDRYVAQTVERPRSNSNTSQMESPYGFGPEIQRRPSVPDYAFQCPPPYQRPMPPAPMPHNSNTPSYQSHLSFGSTPTQYPAPHMPPTPPPVAAAGGMYSPHTGYANIRHPSTMSEYDGTPMGYPMAPQMQNGYPKNNMNNMNMNQYRVEAPKPTPYLIQDPQQYLPPPHMIRHDQTPTMGHVGISAMKALSSEYVNIQPSIESIPPSPGGYDSFSGKRMLYHTGPTGTKRSHEDSFGIDDRPMHNGMRPDAEPYPNAYRDFSAESRAALMAELGVDMAYKRANGRMVMKIPAGQ